MKTKRFLSLAAIMAIFAFSLASCEDKKEEDPAAREARREARKEALKDEVKKELQAEAVAAAKAAEMAAKAAAEKKKQEKIAKEKAIAMEWEKKIMDLDKNPSKYIKTVGQCNVQVSGVVNLYINLKACTFVNNSEIGIEEISGNFIITTSKGTIITPFKTGGYGLNGGSSGVLPIIGIGKVQIPGKLINGSLEILKVVRYHEGG